jgi:hypothetical protein
VPHLINVLKSDLNGRFVFEVLHVKKVESGYPIWTPTLLFDL